MENFVIDCQISADRCKIIEQTVSKIICDDCFVAYDLRRLKRTFASFASLSYVADEAIEV
jgi:hypothetical protein